MCVGVGVFEGRRRIDKLKISSISLQLQGMGGEGCGGEGSRSPNWITSNEQTILAKGDAEEVEVDPIG